MSKLMIIFGCILSVEIFARDVVSSELLIKMERTRGFGSYPVYTVSIFESGRVEYQGVDFVKVTGELEQEIAANQVELIKYRLSNSDMSLLHQNLVPDQDGCARSAMHSPYIVMTVKFGGEYKSIKTYLGCDSEQVKKVEELADFIDGAADLKKWVSRER